MVRNTMRSLTIAGRRISDDDPCYVVAELGCNHGGSVQTACALIQAAADAGASACKVQVRDNATLYSPAMLASPYEHENSYGRTYGAHRRALELTDEGLRQCRDHAGALHIASFATAVDEPSADRLMRLGVPAIKLASGSLTDHPLLCYVRTLGVPIILSTGASTIWDVDEAMDRLTVRTSQIALLHCTAAYPVHDYTTLNLRCIETLRQRYPETVIGWRGNISRNTL